MYLSAVVYLGVLQQHCMLSAVGLAIHLSVPPAFGVAS